MFSRPMYTAVPIYLVLAACVPNNVTMTEGSYVAFVSADTSTSLLKGEIDLETFGGTTYNIDCREFETLTEEEANDRRLPDALPVCSKKQLRDSDLGVSRWPGDVDDAAEEPYFPNYSVFGPNHEEWIFQGPFHVVTEELVPWRGEGLITAEDDIQVAFHHRLPDGSDFRFAFVIDPDFAPTTCVEEEDTEEVVAEAVDGDWLANWSADFAEQLADASEEEAAPYAHMADYVTGGGTVWALTAGAYQLNPSDTEDYWFFPEEYSAGYASGKFVEERMSARAARYGEPYIYNFIDSDSALMVIPGASDIWHCDMNPDETSGDFQDPMECPMCDRTEGQWDTSDSGGDDFCEMGDRVNRVADEVQEELNLINPNDLGTLNYRPLVLENSWRVPDGREPGLDGWKGMHYNYVVFSKDSGFEEGDRAEGAFSLVMDASDTKSRVFLKGRFVIDPLKKDRWIQDDLKGIKLEESPDVENEEALCFNK